MAHGRIDQSTRECIENCLSCYSICQETTNHCLTMGGRHSEASHIRTLLDCAEMCRTNAGFMLRGSLHHESVCEVCAAVCEDCEHDCRRMAEGDDLMLRCADMCRLCAESCRQMAEEREHAQT